MLSGRIVQVVFDEGGDILHIRHGFDIRPLPHHGEFTARNLTQKVIHIPPVLFAKDNRGPYIVKEFSISEKSQARYFSSASHLVRP
jgi:hypothetical protein